MDWAVPAARWPSAFNPITHRQTLVITTKTWAGIVGRGTLGLADDCGEGVGGGAWCALFGHSNDGMAFRCLTATNRTTTVLNAANG